MQHRTGNVLNCCQHSPAATSFPSAELPWHSACQLTINGVERLADTWHRAASQRTHPRYRRHEGGLRKNRYSLVRMCTAEEQFRPATHVACSRGSLNAVIAIRELAVTVARRPIEGSVRSGVRSRIGQKQNTVPVKHEPNSTIFAVWLDADGDAEVALVAD